NSYPSETHIEGSDATITVSGYTRLGDIGELIIHPTANGAAGLTSIDSHHLQFNPGGTLELDTSLYAPQVGDSWDVFTYTGTVYADPGPTNLVAPAGYTIIQEPATPGLIRITVTGVPTVNPTIAASLSCLPSSGTLPFNTTISVELANLYTGQTRRLSGRMDLTLAGGAFYSNWRAGWSNVAAGSSYSTSWNQNL
ncbi:MAG: hypothetical protein GY713_19190, partial [Actinomycetia bacterium]|nr:hypothetical protein [Actinomycetes bacterium]